MEKLINIQYRVEPVEDKWQKILVVGVWISSVSDYRYHSIAEADQDMTRLDGFISNIKTPNIFAREIEKFWEDDGK